MGLRSRSIHAAALGSYLALSTAACGGRSITDEAAGVSGGVSAGGAASSGGAASPGGTNSNTSGAPGSAGDGDVAGGCNAAPPCGGNMIGSWSVVSSCLRVSGPLDLSAIGIGCGTAVITDGYRQITGYWTARADGTHADLTTTTGIDHIELEPACLNVSGAQVRCDALGPIFAAFGYSATSCAKVPEGGCACTASVKQVGGLGIVSVDPSSYGSFSASNNVITLDSGWSYSYCIAADRLTLTPRTVSPTLTGSIVFETPEK
jgi:hypothetical protein